MALNASHFISSRTNVASITEERIRNILWYVAECYLLVIRDKPQYSKKYVQDTTSFHFEDYLKVEFVDNYLIKNKQLIKERLSSLEEVIFSYETEKRFTDLDGKQKKDKIDIFINKLGLTSDWNTQDEHIYFVLECKRIKTLKGCNSYVEDIKKFCTRKYLHLRLPFEGMIGFIENSALSHDQVSDEVTNQLKSHTKLITLQTLKKETFNSFFDGSYASIHQKSYDPKDIFSIYHLFLDYTNIIKN